MKRKIICLLLCLSLLVGVLLAVPISDNTYAISISGGRHTENFDELPQMDLYYELEGQTMTLHHGRLYTPATSETKAVIGDKTYSRVQAEVDITPVIKNGRVDSGFYVQLTSVNNGLDQVIGYNVNIEHATGADTFCIKLHRFNNRYLGAVVEVDNIAYKSDTIHLKVVLFDVMLYVYVYDNPKPVLTYNIGNTEGMIGLRNFHAGVYFDNLSIISEDIPVDKSALDKVIADTAIEDEAVYTEDSLSNYKSALAKVNEMYSSVYQERIDEAVLELYDAYGGLHLIRNKDTAQALITKAEDMLSHADEYIQNSQASVRFTMNMLIEAVSDSDENEIAYWYDLLDYRMAVAVKYGG